jgi:hypothetical protein
MEQTTSSCWVVHTNRCSPRAATHTCPFSRDASHHRAFLAKVSTARPIAALAAATTSPASIRAAASLAQPVRSAWFTVSISPYIQRLGEARKAADLIATEEELPEAQPLALPACGHCTPGASSRPHFRRRPMLPRGGAEASRRSLLRLHMCRFIASQIPSSDQPRDLSTMSGIVSILAGTLLLVTLCGSAVAQTISQTYAAQRQAANRQRCVNGVVIGGVAGGVLARGTLLSRLGGAAIGATAGCVINRGVNEGR